MATTARGDQKRQTNKYNWDDEMAALHEKTQALDLYEFCRSKLAESREETLRPVPLLSGNDLIAAGYAPGPRFKEMMVAVEDAQLEGRLSTCEEALRFVEERFSTDPA